MEDGSFAERKLISRGGSSWVYHGVWKKQSVAIKVVNQDYRAMFETEKKILTLLGSHPNIIKLWEALDSERTLILEVGEIELCRRLFPIRIDQRGPVELQLRLNYAIQIAEGVCWIHRKRVLHMDLNLSNVVLLSGEKVVKIIDFGWSVQLPEGKEEYIGRTPTSEGYTALEVYDQQYSFKSDVYSYGVMLWGLALNLDPQKRSLKVIAPSDFPGCTERQTVFMQTFWVREPKDRPAMTKELIAEIKSQFNIPEDPMPTKTCSIC